jgi:polyisoprenoid-binding protein YceI
MHAALKKEEYPKVVFELEEVKNTSTLTGSLTIAGTKKEVEIEAEMVLEGTSMKLKGVKEITLQDFSMTPPTAMFGQIVVGDKVTVNFDLVFVKE